ncbi:Double zinc ribbon [Candidatus Anstonella stagnisolia]|nr:Double zinc ribbon [Candidatus Anstonella stagnisolia]
MGCMGLLDLVRDALKKRPLAGIKEKCPKCGTQIDLGMEKCPKCGTYVDLMFSMKCPQCKTQNKLDAKRCVKCGHDFEVQVASSGKQVYVCPICGYKADYFMLSCPSCGVKFVS